MIQQRPPAAKGFVFSTMQDEDGLMNLIAKPDIYQRHYKVLRNCFLLIVEGTRQKQGGVLNVLADGAVGMYWGIRLAQVRPRPPFRFVFTKPYPTATSVSFSAVPYP